MAGHLDALLGRRDFGLTFDGEPIAANDLLDTAFRLADPIASSEARVACVFGNTPSFVAALFAGLAARKPIVPLNPQLTAREVADCVRRAGCGMILAPASRDIAGDLAALHPRAVSAVEISHSEKIRAWRVDCQDGAAEDIAHPADTALVQFTSGVSGRPRPFSRTVGDLAREIRAYCEAVGLGEDDGTTVPVPLFHSYGLIPGLLASLSVGASCHVVSRVGAERVRLLNLRYRPRLFLAVPFLIESLNEALPSVVPDFASYRLIVSAGAGIKSETATRFRERYGKEINQLYGTTETGVIAVNARPGDDADRGSVGRPIGGRKVAILADDGTEMPIGKDGEIALSLVDDGDCAPHRTGDLGRLNADGTITITGRKNDVINLAGLKVLPFEVEEVIRSSGEVADCAVVGIRRDGVGESVRAYVVMRPGGDIARLHAFCRAGLAMFKLPREFIAVTEIPRGATGKVLRAVLRERADGASDSDLMRAGA